MLRRTRDHAGNLSSDRLQGLSEIVQNAEDLDATDVRVLTKERELLVAHNGSPVRLPDVLALAMPWLTSKAEQADSTGRFGIGLMTLQSLSPHLEIHCGHYRFRIGDPDLSVAEPFPVPDWFAGDTWTVLRVPLEPGVLGADEVDAWLAEWGDSALLFLGSVGSVTHLDEQGGVRQRLALVREGGEPFEAVVGGQSVGVETGEARAGDGSRWMVCRTTVPSPSGITRSHKAVGHTTAIAVALPLGLDDAGRVYAGLPVADTALALCVSAQYDPIASRQALDDTPWNRALNELVGDLWTAAVLWQFWRDPARAWRAVPLPVDMRDARDPVAALERLLLDRARAGVSHGLVLDVAEQGPLGLGDLAVEDETLVGVVTEEEVSRVAKRTAVLPGLARDEDGRWRGVLADWEDHNGAAPVTVDLYDALRLLDDETRSPQANIRLSAAGLAADIYSSLLSSRWLVDSSGGRHGVPRPAEPVVFTDVPRGLGASLGFSREIHPAFLADTDEARSVRAWLRKRGALLTDADPVAVIRRLAAIGAAENGGPNVLRLTDGQLIELRDGFARVPDPERETLGRDVGHAIRLQGHRYDRAGKREDIDVAPARAYLPVRLDSSEREESFAFAAGRTTGLVWLRPRYAEVLQRGGAGMGARKFLRLLGAETAPRLGRHPRARERFTQSPKGLPADVTSGPRARTDALRALEATFTLDDHESPDLRAVASGIASEQNPQIRRRRAAALFHVLGRAWSRFSDHDEVDAVYDYYAWQNRGRTAAFWLWQLRDTPWLDDGKGAPSVPARLRMRTTGTVAVYGADNERFLHPEIQQLVGRRSDVLHALGISAEARTEDLVECLQRLRRREEEGGDRDVPAALILYQALAERAFVRGTAAPEEMSLGSVLRAFGEGSGLVLTDSGWCRPSQCLRGAPLFGPLRVFAPTFPGSEEFWQRLGVRLPNVDDAAAVIKELAQRDRKQGRDEPDGTTQSIVLETMKMLAAPGRTHPGALTAKRLGRLPLWTSQGWRSKRPVYAVEDPVVAEALGREHAVWCPGAELERFRPLIGALRVSELAAEHVTVYSPDPAQADPDATALVRSAVTHLREDLQRNAASVAQSLDCSWDQLAGLTVCIAPHLACSLDLPDTGETVHMPVDTGIDWSSGTLYVRDTAALTRTSGVGRSIAARFPGSRREVALAWGAACDQVEEGRTAVQLSLADDQVRRDREAAEAERERRLRELGNEVDQRRTATKAQASTAASTSRTAVILPPVPSAQPPATGPSVPPVPPAAAPPRRLVDPGSLRLVDPSGIITPPKSSAAGAPTARPSGYTSGTSGLPQPRAGSAIPQQHTPPRPYTGMEQDKVALDVVRKALATDDDWLRDLRAQRGLGADAVDALSRFYELKAYKDAEPDTVLLTPAEFQRAVESDDFFLVIVSGLEAGTAPVSVRIIPQPLQQLTCRPSSSVTVTGIRGAHSRVYQLEEER
ncbi:sacsin N-terminal ATP-binding-like domain-containing protein [Streptomyces sp. SLBN-8D4]|uniref:sacsin N-terminal ATP-binding-like domain-containing protein n=1 Tax=Streptomyces sp. SLBN-8D4 TaxID=3377728 RepID=UPI003C7C2EC2